jgi:dsRNA-specific ribonuclease
MIPAPQEKNWNPRLREYENLARDADFQLCMRDMVERTGVTDENLRDMFVSDGRPRMEVYTEFAKCFVPKSVDPINNYELYEIAGDYALNKSTFGYLFRILFPLLSAKGSPQALSYMDAVKAFYVSTKFYSQLPAQLGLTEFLHRVCYDNQAIDRFLSANNKKIEDLYEDLMEAFIGCLELQIDRYIGMHRGYVFVANFVFDLLESMNLNFQPSFFWESARLLKETNDSINSYNKSSAQKLPRYTIDSIAKNMFAVKVSIPGDRETISQSFGQINGDRKTAETYFAPLIIEQLSRDPRYRGLVKRAPTPEELGIESLFK